MNDNLTMTYFCLTCGHQWEGMAETHEYCPECESVQIVGSDPYPNPE